MDLIATVSTQDDEPALVSRWLEHYRREGVTRFHLFWNQAPALTEQEAGVHALLDAPDVQVVLQYEGVVDEALRVERFSEYAGDALADRAVVLVVDSDELVYAPGFAAEAMIAGGFDFVRGTFVDRFGLGGHTPAIAPGAPLGRTFPLCSHYTSEALGGMRTKVPLARPGLRYRPGVHRLEDEAQRRRPPWTLPVHHFKWRAGVVARIRDRVARGFGGEVYLEECRRFLAEYARDDAHVELEGITCWLEVGE